MTFDSENELFPQLNRRALTERAERWATDEKYKGRVIKINLHEYISEELPFRYTVLFHFDFSKIKKPEEKKISKDVTRSTIPITNAASFLSVYKGNPPDKYPKEWAFLAVDKDEKLTFLSPSSWQLYPAIDQQKEQKTKSPQEETSNEATSQESAGDFVKRLRAEGQSDEVIAWKLHDPDGKFKLTLHKVALELGLDEGLNKTQYDTIKQRGKRMCDRGKKILSSSAKK